MTILQFSDFELDEAHRELRLNNREIALQPRVFDLLCYLVRHRDRVVSKDELFDTLWPDVIVTEGSLQRAISLARSALRQGGLQDAIRTHSRSGYRFCHPVSESQETSQVVEITSNLQQARAAYEQYNWESAVEDFVAADQQQALDGPDLDRFAYAIQCTGRSWEAIEPLERAVIAHTTRGDDYAAARAMLSLSVIQFEQREYAIAKAWHQRALRLLPAKELSREYATALWIGSRFSAIYGELEAARDEAERAYRIGCEIGDADIQALGLNYLGLALQALGEVDRGAAIQDEGAATVLAGNVSPVVGGLIYCGVIWSCRNRGDWDRAAQWTDQFTRWCKTSPLHNFPGTCRLHRAEVLSVRGELIEAENEAKTMCESLSIRAPWAEGNAYHVLGDIYLLRGLLDQAEDAFTRAHELGWDPQPGYALLLFERGEVTAALQTLEHSLHDSSWANQQRRGLLLSNYIIVSIAANELSQAKQAMAELEARPQLTGTDSLAAQVSRAKAEIANAEGDLNGAKRNLQQAIRYWQNVGSPLNVATNRLRLTQLLIEQENYHNAKLELQSAEKCFQTIGVETMLDKCAALRKQLV